MGEFVSFQQVSQEVKFEDLLNFLNIPFERKKNELKGQVDGLHFIINTEKNLFFDPTNNTRKGSVVNFLSALKGIDVRSAALELKHQFLTAPEAPQGEKKEIPDLTLDHEHKFLKDSGISAELAKEWEVGWCKRGIMANRLTFCIRDKSGQKVAYTGLDIRPDAKIKWLFPKGYSNVHIYGLHRLLTENSNKDGTSEIEFAEVYVDPLDAIKNNGLALLNLNATTEQIELLGEIKKVLLIHPAGENIGLRLQKLTFVKTMLP